MTSEEAEALRLEIGIPAQLVRRVAWQVRWFGWWYRLRERR